MPDFEQKQGSVIGAKMSDDGHGFIEGYAAVKGNVDSYGDVIMDGAFKGLGEMVEAGYSGLNHSSVPVGYFVDAKEDAKGLFVKIAFHSTPDAQEVRTKIAERVKAGKSVGMSIMFRTIESSYGERDGQEVRELKSIEVVEAGFVTLPANKSAAVTSVKGAGTTLAQDFDSARESVKKVIDRLVDLKGSVNGELSAGRVKIAEELFTECKNMLEAVSPDDGQDEPAGVDVVAELAPTW